VIRSFLDFAAVAKSNTLRSRLLLALDRLLKRINTKLGSLEELAYSLLVLPKQDEDSAIASELSNVLRKLYRDADKYWCDVFKVSGGYLTAHCYVVRCRRPRAAYAVTLHYRRGYDIAYVPYCIKVMPVEPSIGFDGPCYSEPSVRVFER